MLMKKAKLILSALFMLLGVAVFAQNVTVRGTVKDATTGEAIPFAAIQIKGTSTGSATDANGAYVITAPSRGSLQQKNRCRGAFHCAWHLSLYVIRSRSCQPKPRSRL